MFLESLAEKYRRTNYEAVLCISLPSHLLLPSLPGSNLLWNPVSLTCRTDLTVCQLLAALCIRGGPVPCSGCWGLQLGWACAYFWPGWPMQRWGSRFPELSSLTSQVQKQVVGMKVPRDPLSKLSGSLNFRECSCPGKPGSWAAGVSQAGHRPCSIRHLLAGCRHIVFHCRPARKTNCLPLSPNQPSFSAALPPLSCFLSKEKLWKCTQGLSCFPLLLGWILHML